MIFVVDDHNESAEYLVRLLRKAGYEARAFSCGEDLMRELATQRPQLIVLDMMMPNMNGIECIAQLRARAETASIPVIFYTADFAYETLEAARKAGANEVLIKGVTRWPEFKLIISKYVPAA